MEYSLSKYKSILELALENGYKFIGFQESEGVRPKTIYLRHDIDYSLEMALAVAKINSSLGIQGTFFILLRSQVYNPFSSWSLHQINTLSSLGQRLAFHYAAADPNLQFDSIENNVLSDFDIMRRIFPKVEPVFSWHNPTNWLERISSIKVDGLINTYADKFIKTILYLSDSNLRHKVDYFKQSILEDHKRIHFLFHPFNWVAGGDTMKDIFSTTWKFIIQEREKEMSLNNFYKSVMPEGMPDAVLDSFSDEWRRAVDYRTI